MNMFEKIFNRPKNPKEEEHNISIEANQHEFNARLEGENEIDKTVEKETPPEQE